MRASALVHRLDAACPECQCPQWMHNEKGCLKLRRKGTTNTANGAKVAPLRKCRCSKRAGDFQ